MVGICRKMQSNLLNRSLRYIWGAVVVVLLLVGYAVSHHKQDAGTLPICARAAMPHASFASSHLKRLCYAVRDDVQLPSNECNRRKLRMPEMADIPDRRKLLDDKSSDSVDVAVGAEPPVFEKCMLPAYAALPYADVRSMMLSALVICHPACAPPVLRAA